MLADACLCGVDLLFSSVCEVSVFPVNITATNVIQRDMLNHLYTNSILFFT